MSREIQQRVPAWLIAVAVCLALVASAVAPATNASAQSLLFDVGVDFPEFVVLWYWDQINIDISSTELTNYLFGQTSIDAGTQTRAAGFVGGNLQVDVGIDTVVDDGVLNDPCEPLWLGVTNAWALRSVSASGDTQVSIKVKEKRANLPGGGGNRIEVNDAQVAAASSVGSTIVVPSTGSTGLLWGTIFLQIDIQKALRAGQYSGIVVEITAENI